MTLNHIFHLHKMIAANRLSDILQCPAGAAPHTCLKTFRQLFIQRTKNLYEQQIAFHRTCLDSTLNIKDGDLAEKGNFGGAPNSLGLSETM